MARRFLWRADVLFQQVSPRLDKRTKICYGRTIFENKEVRKMRTLKRASQWLIVIKRLRQTTGASWLQVKDYLRRRGYWPMNHRKNFVSFVNDPFVIHWTSR